MNKTAQTKKLKMWKKTEAFCSIFPALIHRQTLTDRQHRRKFTKQQLYHNSTANSVDS